MPQINTFQFCLICCFLHLHIGHAFHEDMCSREGKGVKVPRSDGSCEEDYTLIFQCCHPPRECGPGTESDEDTKLCVPCERGTFRSGSREMCLACLRCDFILRVTQVVCVPKNNTVCGPCLTGFVETHESHDIVDRQYRKCTESYEAPVNVNEDETTTISPAAEVLDYGVHVVIILFGSVFGTTLIVICVIAGSCGAYKIYCYCQSRKSGCVQLSCTDIENGGTSSPRDSLENVAIPLEDLENHGDSSPLLPPTPQPSADDVQDGNETGVKTAQVPDDTTGTNGDADRSLDTGVKRRPYQLNLGPNDGFTSTKNEEPIASMDPRKSAPAREGLPLDRTSRSPVLAPVPGSRSAEEQNLVSPDTGRETMMSSADDQVVLDPERTSVKELEDEPGLDRPGMRTPDTSSPHSPTIDSVRGTPHTLQVAEDPSLPVSPPVSPQRPTPVSSIGPSNVQPSSAPAQNQDGPNQQVNRVNRSAPTAVVRPRVPQQEHGRSYPATTPHEAWATDPVWHLRQQAQMPLHPYPYFDSDF